MPSTKRPRSNAEENRAECPYTIRTRLPTQVESRQHFSKKRKSEGPDEERKAEWHWQNSPFNPKGKFKTNETVDVKYAVDPPAGWQAMTRYSSFVLGKEKFHTDDYVYVANEESVKRQRTADGTVPPRRLTDDWVARIVEIRALNEQNVFARVFWMYWPDELPAGTIDGRKTVKGRQPYHGEHELIASNHMDVINAVSVTSPAKVNQWTEADDEDTQPSLYWRQVLNIHNSQISSAKPVCKCETPAHPDKMLISCSNKECGKWMHDDCLRHEALMRVYERLGKTTPQVFSENDTVVKKEGEDTVASTPTPAPAPAAPNATQETKEEITAAEAPTEAVKLPLFTPPAPQTATPVAKKGVKKEPYRGLFDATLDLDSGPSVWHIKDLRDNVTGGTKEWRERARCLFCSSLLD